MFRGDKCGPNLKRVCSAQWVTLDEPLRQLPSDFNGCHFRPLIPGSQQIAPSHTQSSRGLRFFSASSRNRRKQLHPRKRPDHYFGVLPIPTLNASRSSFGNKKRNNRGCVPKPHQPLRRSFNRSFSTLSSTRAKGRLSNQARSPDEPRRTRPFRSSRARRSSGASKARDEPCKGTIFATGWLRSITKMDSPLLTWSR